MAVHLNIAPIAGIVAAVTDQERSRQQPLEPPTKHVAADRAGKTLVNLAGSINAALDSDSEPIVVNRKGRHVSLKDLEDLIDRALEGDDDR